MEEVKTEQSGRGSEEIIMTMIIPLGLGLIQVIGGERFSKGGGGMETNELVEGTWLVRRLSAAVVSTYDLLVRRVLVMGRRVEKKEAEHAKEMGRMQKMQRGQENDNR